MKKLVLLNLIVTTAAVVSPPLSLAGAADQDKEDIQTSIVRYKSAVEVNGKNSTTRVKLGNAYLMNGELDNAAEQYKEAIKLEPTSSEGHLGVARVYIRKRDYDGAIGALKDALKHAPNDAELHFKLGQVLSQKHRDDDAINEYRQSIRFNTNHAGAHRELGAALGVSNDPKAYDSEIAEENKAIEINPNDPDAYYYLGSAYLNMAKPQDAQKSFEKCVALDPKNAEGFHLLAVALGAQKSYSQGILAMRSALKLEPNNPDYMRTLKKLQDRLTQK